MNKFFTTLIMVAFATSFSFGQSEKSFLRSKVETTITDHLKQSDAVSYEVGESFEGEFPPEGWLNIDQDGDDYQWVLGEAPTFECQDGTKCAYSESWSSAAGALIPDNWLITPAFTVAPGDKISWWIAAQDPNYPNEKYGVYLSNTTNDIQSFDITLHNQVLTSTEWEQFEYDLSEYAGQTMYAAFRHWDVSDQFIVKLDNVILPGGITGIEDEITNNVAVFPNPSTGLVHINNAQGCQIFVFNMLGKKVATIEKASQEDILDLSKIDAGTYCVKVVSAQNTSTQMLVITK